MTSRASCISCLLRHLRARFHGLSHFYGVLRADVYIKDMLDALAAFHDSVPFYAWKSSNKFIMAVIHQNLLIIAACIGCVIVLVNSHGILYEPPNRASLWRFPEYQQFNVTECYTDNELFCGGIGIQYQQNKGKCGICGDAYHIPRPRPNENGGKFGKNVIARAYKQGQDITVSVHLTANHLGTFQFNICSRGKNASTVEEESCFDKYPLELADGSGSVYHLPSTKIQASGYFNTTLRLPTGLKCTYCTLRWHYRTANSWGICEDGTGAQGCGNQEIFRNCADVRIF